MVLVLERLCPRVELSREKVIRGYIRILLRSCLRIIVDRGGAEMSCLSLALAGRHTSTGVTPSLVLAI